MPARALTVTELAAELGRSKEWLYEHWQHLCEKKGMPRPLIEGGSLSWSAPQIYAWMDRPLTKEQRACTAAYRAAFEAAIIAPKTLNVADELIEATERMNTKWRAA